LRPRLPFISLFAVTEDERNKIEVYQRRNTGYNSCSTNITGSAAKGVSRGCSSGCR